MSGKGGDEIKERKKKFRLLIPLIIASVLFLSLTALAQTGKIQKATELSPNLIVTVTPAEARVDIYEHDKGSIFKREFVDNGSLSLNLPEGKYWIVILRGYEYQPHQEEVEIKEKEIKKINVNLKHLYNMNKLGWYSGDAHMHTIYSDGKQKFPILVRAAKAEGLNWIITTEHNEGVIKSWEHLHKHNYNTPLFQLYFGEEVTTFHSGHFNALGAEGYLDYRLPLEEIIAQTHKYKGLIVANHPFSGPLLGNLSSYFWQVENGYAKFQPDLDGVEVWNGGWEWEDEEALKYYFHLLNQGYKFFASANTDTHNFYSTPPGTPRTYVYLGEKKLSKEEVKTALKLAKIFLTSGPLLQFDINGKTPGETLKVKLKENITFNIKIKSIYNLSSLFIIKNGFVFYYNGKLTGKEHMETVSFPADKNSWYLLRVLGENGTQAITNPIWIKVD